MLAAVGRPQGESRLRRRLSRVADPLVQALVLAVTEPDNAQRTHRTLSALGNVHLSLSFRREPLARLLFELSEWAAETSDRGPIVAVLMRDALTHGGAFHHLARMELGESIIGARYSLAEITALGLGTDPPETPSRSWFEANLPDRFHALIEPLFGPATTPGRGDALARRFRTPFPTGSTFLLGPYLTFLHTYLARNLVDALPRVAERVREAALDHPSILSGQAGRMRARPLEES